MNELITFLLDNSTVIVTALTSLIAAASAVANFTDSEADNKAVAFMAKIVNFLALNFKK